MKRLILTGFEPFGSYKVNPTEKAARTFDGKTIGGYEVLGLTLSCTYRSSFETLRRIIETLRPNAVVSTGLASRVGGIRFEKIGYNEMAGKYPDAFGFSPNGDPVIHGEEQSFNANANNEQLWQEVDGAGIPAELSEDPERFICNALLYQTSRYVARQRQDMRNVFIHTPWTSDTVGNVELEPGKIVLSQEALYEAIHLILKHIND